MFTLPDLPFANDALVKFCSANTFNFHHGKHHAGYVKKLNAAIENTPLADKPLEEVIVTLHKENSLGTYNNAAQHFNHSLFWNSLAPDGGGDPTGTLRELIDRDFGSPDKLREEFTNMSKTLFGSGWVFLAQNSEGKLELVAAPNAGTPMTEGKTALLTLDVWEHAYYLDYQNERARYVDEFWNVTNWSHAASLLK